MATSLYYLNRASVAVDFARFADADTYLKYAVVPLTPPQRNAVLQLIAAAVRYGPTQQGTAHAKVAINLARQMLHNIGLAGTPVGVGDLSSTVTAVETSVTANPLPYIFGALAGAALVYYLRRQ